MVLLENYLRRRSNRLTPFDRFVMSFYTDGLLSLKSTRQRMLDRMRALIHRIMSRTQPGADQRREQLTEARANLNTETDKLERDVQSVGRKSDPIDAIIRNIKQASGRR